MKRTLMQQLVAWKSSRNRKPLLISGARQTGKSWLMNEFGSQYYERVARIDFTDNERMRALFDGDFDINRLVTGISIETGVAISAHNTLIILDEIQEAPRAITALKYFYEKNPEYHVVAAGSLLGIASHQDLSFPVGKVDSLTLYPLNFFEFLQAKGQDVLADLLATARLDAVAPVFSDKLAGYLKEYLFVGGMPEVVADYVEHGDMVEVRRLQTNILNDYDRDFSKHAPLRILERLRTVWAAIPSQLAKENRRFVYGAVRQGARARDLEECIRWLVDYGVASKVPRVAAISMPPASYEDVGSFKLFTLDTGLLGALAGLDASSIIDGSAIFREFKGSITEQYVQQQLVSIGLQPFYWSAEASDAEVDFVVAVDAQVLPVEVKAEENHKAKSLRVACDKFKLQRAVRTSLSGYRDEGWLVNVPLWAIGALPEAA
jgi:predicted AAA+ superfamily ATPase